MSIPEKCSVLVVGGGPGGSYAAAALAREGVDTVILEADLHPRYHVGESMLPSLRHFLRFIDCDDKFLQHGFQKKVGGAFALNQQNTEGYTDFIKEGGPNHFTWNVVRSEADELLFRHAESQGAKAFDGVKVTEVQFVPTTEPGPGRPVSATWKRKSDGATGKVSFEYIVDASGRVGILNTKHIKNRLYNQGLKNVAAWGYWKDSSMYAVGTSREGSPFFEALTDESGWAWFIPLHDGTQSVGIVQNQDKMTAKKAASGLSSKDFYLDQLKLAPRLKAMLGTMVSEVKNASDYSYNSSSYAIPYARVVGDAGCFIDPFFSSGVHLAMTGALAAATTICAVKRGDCDEEAATRWHSQKIKEGYSRWLLIVLSAYRQMNNQLQPVLSDFGEDNFDRAFDFFKPVIQGTADVTTKLTQGEFSKALDFVSKVFDDEFVIPDDAEGAQMSKDEDFERSVVAMRQAQSGDRYNMQSFTMDVIDGRVPRLITGNLGLDLPNTKSVSPPSPKESMPVMAEPVTVS